MGKIVPKILKKMKDGNITNLHELPSERMEFTTKRFL